MIGQNRKKEKGMVLRKPCENLLQAKKSLFCTQKTPKQGEASQPLRHRLIDKVPHWRNRVTSVASLTLQLLPSPNQQQKITVSKKGHPPTQQ